jgi:hypothetical protein
MKLVKIFNHSDGYVDPEGEHFLVVTASVVDGPEPWMPSSSQLFSDGDELRNWLIQVVASGEQIVIRATNKLTPLIQDLGLIHLASEWRTA